ncbi:MAG TPA: excisionase family DNA-binding protein [Candidatus Mediterraneibacter surreyensis]|nr:excisionase family DNA-binding protein [Candidatus Mediterraneibacter surreyensis]
MDKIALTVYEASEYTGIGRTNLRQLIAWGKIPSIRIGRKILIRREVLDEFIRLNEGNNLMNKYEIIAV